MGGLTLLTFWLVQKNTPLPINVIERPRQHEPDYTIKNGALSYLNEQGQTKYRILGKELIHYDDDASIDIVQPRMRLFQPDKSPVTVRAKRGHIDGDITILDLFDNVEIYRPPQAASETQKASPYMLAKSSYFQVLINDDIIKTNKPVELEQGLSVIMCSKACNYLAQSKDVSSLYSKENDETNGNANDVFPDAFCTACAQFIKQSCAGRKGRSR
jgi:lipopolysaccharide export system protein LptC